MKNGDARSAQWIARNLKAYTRDDEATQSALCLVDIRPIPSVIEIASWSAEQCLLAHDWAMATHFSASDNNNRVPAIPEFLQAYRPMFPPFTPREIAIRSVRAMGDDNSTCFHPTAAQWKNLEEGIARMRKAGCHFTDAEIDLWAAGEDSEMRDHFEKIDGYAEAQKVMCQIFELEDDAGETDGLAGVRTHEPPPAGERPDPAIAWPFPSGTSV